LYIESDCPDAPLQPSQMVNIMIYGEGFTDLAGFQVALNFVGPDGPAAPAACSVAVNGTIIGDHMEIRVRGPVSQSEGCDVNDDGRVNILDLVLIRNHQNTSATEYDVTGDTRVNILDFLYARNEMGSDADWLVGGVAPLYNNITITEKTWLMTATFVVGEAPPAYCNVRPSLDYTIVSDQWANQVVSAVQPAQLRVGESPACAC